MKKNKIAVIIAALLISIFALSACRFDTLYTVPRLPVDSGSQSTQTEILGAQSNAKGSVKITLPTPTAQTNALSDTNLYAVEVANNKMGAVLNLIAQTKSAGSSSAGTGFIITNDGYVITNAHVVTYEKTEIKAIGNKYYKNIITVSHDDIYASFDHAPEKYYIMQVLEYDTSLDLAVLKFDDRYFFNENNQIERICEFTNSQNLQNGEPVVAIGNAQGLGLSVTFGGVSKAYVQKYSAILISVPINPGNSGGPLFNAQSFVVGVNSSKLVDANTDNMGFAIPSNSVKDYLDSLTLDIDYVYV